MVKQMFVIKRDGTRAPVLFDKITSRITKLCYKLNAVNPIFITQQIIQSLTDGIHTKELDVLAQKTCIAMSSTHYEYDILATRLAVSNLHKSTSKSFFNVATALYNYVHPILKQPTPLLASDVYEFIKTHKETLDSAVLHDRDLSFDFFGFQTLCEKYLIKLDNVIVERPQHLFMRVACGIHVGDIDAALETYHWMSEKYFIHATPTLFNAGTTRGQLASCFLQSIKADSIEGIYDTLKESAQISARCGGIGLAITNIRANGSYIRGSNGTSNGILPFMCQFDHMIHAVDQGGKRKGVAAMYLEPWHADVFAFLDIHKNTGPESERARNSFAGIWIPDELMRRVENDEDWCLFCPNEAPGLWDCHGEEFKKLYTYYETQPHLIRRKLKARELWRAILVAEIETGIPYILYKDAANAKSNQSNLGTIRCSNLCTEIIQYSSADEVAVCNLASLVLHRYVNVEAKTFDFEKLGQGTRILVRNLNKVIDRTLYPIIAAERSNKRHRPIGIGAQGFQEACTLLRFPYDSPEAANLNRHIFETIYYYACDESVALAIKQGAYETFSGSFASRGQLQPDLWNVTPQTNYDWAGLRERCVKHGMRNSLLVTLMPTATTANIMGSSESCEPYATILGAKSTLAGTFPIVNKYAFRDLVERGLWSVDLKNKIIANDGSIQDIEEIPQDLKDLYKTVWEIKGKVIIDMSADRGAFICQSQSLNCHMTDITFTKLSSYHFYAWKKGLKTSVYYLRSKAASSPVKFTIDVATEKKTREKHSEKQLQKKHNRTAFDSDKQNEEDTTTIQAKRTKLEESDQQKQLQKKHNHTAFDSDKQDKEDTTTIQAKRTKPDSDQQEESNFIQAKLAQLADTCSLENREACTSCSS